MTQRAISLSAVAGVMLCAMLVPSRTPLLVWNASASAPLGLYALHPATSLAAGDLVLAKLPQNFAEFAATRGYLPMGVPLVKRIAALAGDTICSTGQRITINGHRVAVRLSTDSQARPLPAWRGCRTLQSDQVFLLMAGVRDSFDGRYFGPVQRSAILGTVRPVWTH